MLATNICIWLHVFIVETKRELLIYEMVNSTLNSNLKEDPRVNLDHLPEAHYYRGLRLMSSLVQSTAPYLSPCVIQHSIICAAILYITWSDIANRHPPKSTDITPTYHPAEARVNSFKGLFIGIILLVVTVMSLILFHVLVDSEMSRLAVSEVAACELALQVTCSVAALFGLWYLPRQAESYGTSARKLDGGLLLVTQTGALAYSAFTLVAGAERLTASREYLQEAILVTGAAGASLVQTVLQTALLLGAVRRTPDRPRGGGQLVALLLAGNAAAWALGAALRPRPPAHRLQLRHYGPAAWTYVAYLTTPLQTLYRLHSALCLLRLWRTGISSAHPPAYM